METYRRAVEAVIRDKAQLACFLSEDWTGSFDQTVQKCRDRVLSSAGFMLLLGYYYGWVPDGLDRSITHSEFDWAFTKWRHLPRPPMSVFAPARDSEADKLLREAAAQVLAAGGTDPEQHAARLQAFRSAVLDGGRTAQFYKNQYELRENAIVACYQWMGRTPMSVAGMGGHSAVVSDAQLGTLGRKAQLDAVEEVMAQFYTEDEPCAALLVQGDQDAGQRVFLCAVSRAQSFETWRPAAPGHPPSDGYDAGVLAAWIAGTLGVAPPGQVQTVDDLAEAIHRELQLQPLFFLLDRIERFSGGLNAFVQNVWKPLWMALKGKQPAVPNRLVAFLSAYSAVPDSLVSDPESFPLDCSLPIALPDLTDFKPKDVNLWLHQLGVKDQPAGRRAQLTQLALSNDTKPLRVFEQLRSIELFPNI